MSNEMDTAMDLTAAAWSTGPGPCPEWCRDTRHGPHVHNVLTVLRSLPVEQRAAAVGLAGDGYVVIRDQPDHFVTFDENGWFIEHSIACRVAGTIATCEYKVALREIAAFDAVPDPADMGRWRISNIDSEGLPSLERAADLEPAEEQSNG